MIVDTKKLTIKEVREHLDRGDFSATDLADANLDAITKKDADVHAYLEVYDDVHAQAEEADRRLRAGEQGALIGIPLALKDNILRKGRTASAASRILEDYTAPYDATVVAKLKEAGAIFLGRTNMDEFAMGSSTEHSAFGPTKNPHDTMRVPGGSSGGSSGAVSYGGALAALGSDTGGSIRQPASFCGVVGLKPTYGSVSRYGLIALGSSLDVIGPLGRSVDDVEAIFDVIVGHDPMDATSRAAPEGAARDKSEKLTIGIERSILETEGLDTAVRKNFEEAMSRCRDLGYEVKDISLPHVKHSLAVYYIVMPAEASANLARYDGVKYGLHKEGATLLDDYLQTRGEGFGAEVRRRIMFGTYVLSAGYYDAYYGNALKVRALITREFDDAFKTIDLIASPTTPTPAFTIGEKSDPVSMYLSDIFTVPANIAGLPAISVPCGSVDKGGVELPLGVQFTAPDFREDRLFTVGRALEESL